jgi:hypothetical protein
MTWGGEKTVVSTMVTGTKCEGSTEEKIGGGVDVAAGVAAGAAGAAA